MENKRAKIFNEAIRIGDQLCEQAEKSTNGFYFKTLRFNNNFTSQFDISEGLYGGNAGVSLFLLELYKQTKSEKFLSYVVSNAKFLSKYMRENKANSYAFLTGRLGVCYFFIKLYDVTKEHKYLSEAKLHSKKCIALLKDENTINDFLNGVSGIILFLLHLLNVCDEVWIVNAIDELVEHLLKNSQLTKKGIYWNRSKHHNSALCGLSHGVSGVAYCLGELGRVSGNQCLSNFSEELLNYEDKCFDTKIGNWPDFRNLINSDSDFQVHKKMFKDNRHDFFCSGKDMNAWCHGAMGIGLTRLRFHELYHSSKYQKEYELAINKTLGTSRKVDPLRASFTICHGHGGNAELFIRAYEHTRDHKYLNYAESIALLAIDAYKKNGMYISGLGHMTEEDTSLFMGISGIGYFYLRLLFPDETPSILSFDCEFSNVRLNQKLAKLTDLEINKLILNKSFGNTFRFMENELMDRLGALNKETIEQDIENLVKISKNKSCKEAFLFDKKCYKLVTKELSPTLININRLIAQDDIEILSKLPKVEFVNARMKLFQGIELHQTYLNFEKDNVDSAKEDFHYLLVQWPEKLTKTLISKFQYIILKHYEKTNCINEVAASILDIFDYSENESLKIEEAIFTQVRVFLRSGILEPIKN